MPAAIPKSALRGFLCLILSAAIGAADAPAQQASDSLAAQEEAAVRAAVSRVADSVVQIRTVGGLQELDRTLLPDGPTTGVIIAEDGWILSSAFNFVHQPVSILVTLPSGEQAPATLVAKDHSRMLVLLKVQNVSSLTVPELVPESEIRVGQWAVAVGRTFRADRPNASVGIVSALGRMFGKVIQTDANVSRANYGGPLVDVRGRVFGVIVPIAPQTTSEVAGAEWYDSGIGFAVPLDTIDEAIERMKQGEDQHTGVLGVSLGNDNPHASPAEVAAVLPNSPAGRAGLRKGDRITEVDGQPIRTLTDLRFAQGRRYAGEEVELKIVRGDDELDRTLTLAGELEPYRHGFLGILPMRDAADEVSEPKDEPSDDDPANEPQNNGIAVRMVFAGSPAAAAIQTGDRLLSIDDHAVVDIGEAISAMNNVALAADVTVRVLRDGRPLELALTAGRLPSHVPSQLPPAYASPLPPADGPPKPVTATRELKLAEFAETCQVYVPPSYEAGREAGVLLWLHAPGEPPGEDLFRQWRSICNRDGLLLVVPTAADPSRWDRTELEYLRRLSERVLSEYRVDRQRVVVFGQEGGGAMAYLLALVSRDIFTGVATSAAALPRNIRVPANDPAARLAIFTGLAADDGRAAQAQVGLKKLADAGYPVTAVALAKLSGQLSPDERQQLARWIDSLDRF